MWRQSLAEKKDVSPSEALSPDQTPSVAPCASSLSMFSFRLCDVSAVDGKAGSGDEPRFFRREVRDEAGDLRYVTHSFQRNERLSQLCVRRTHIGGRRSRLNIVDRDSARGQIDGIASNKTCKRSLGHAVDTCSREGGADSCVATDDNDPAAIVHLLGGCLNTDEGGTDVDGQHAVEAFESISVDCTPGENARVADEDVKSAEGFRSSGHSGAQLFGRAAVGLEGQRFASCEFDFANKFEGLFWGTGISEGNGRAIRRESADDACSDAS